MAFQVGKYRIHCEQDIAISHQLKHHKGKCKNVHGHNFKVVVDVESSEISSNGMVMDFGVIKDVIRQYDHKHLNDLFVHTVLEQDPTAERMANLIAGEIFNLAPLNSSVNVRIYETEKNYAEFHIDCYYSN